MEALKKKYDRVILVVVSVIAIAVSALLAMKSFGFSERFKLKDPKAGDDLGETGIEKVIAAADHYGAATAWTLPTMPGVADKKLPLYKSVPVVLKPSLDGSGGELIDLRDPNAPQLRPPMDNAFLADNNLRYLRDDVGKLDPDNDGFTNEQEFVWGRTNPKDGEDHPPFYRKLYLTEMIAEPYVLKLNGVGINEDTFTIRRDEPNRSTIYDAPLNAPLNDTKGDGARFTPLKFTKKEVEGATGLLQDISELELSDAENPGETLVLVYRNATNWPTKFAVFGFSHPEFENWNQKVKLRESFTLPNDPKTSYKVESVDDQGAKISVLENGTTKIIEIPTQISPN